MLDALNAILEIVGNICSFVVQMITGIIQLLSLIPQCVATLTQAIGFVPSIVSGFAAVTITVSVIFIIVGRESGGGS